MNKNYIIFNELLKEYVVKIKRVNYRRIPERKTRKKFERNMILKVYGSLSQDYNASIKDKYTSEMISKLMKIMRVPAPSVKVIKTSTIIKLAENNPNPITPHRDILNDIKSIEKEHPYSTILENVGNYDLKHQYKAKLSNKSIRLIGRIAFAELLLLKMTDRHWANYRVQEKKGTIKKIYTIDFEDLYPQAGIDYKVNSQALSKLIKQILNTYTIDDDMQFIKGLNDARQNMIRNEKKISELLRFYSKNTPVVKKETDAIKNNIQKLKSVKLGGMLKILSESHYNLEKEMKKDIYLF